MNDIVESNETRIKNRSKIAQIESFLKQHTQVEMPITHRYAKGPHGIIVYSREMFAPAGTIAVGKIHKHENISVISKGSCSVFTEEGKVERVNAPASWVAPPGTKRVAYFHEDTIWTTFHACFSDKPEEIEKEMIAESFDDPALISDALAAISKLEGK